MNCQASRGFTLVELLLVVAMIGVISAIAIPSLLRSKMAANEAASIAGLRAINSAQSTYSASCAFGFYAPGLSVLGTAPANGTAFISPDLGVADTVARTGYEFTIGSTTGVAPAAPATCNGVAAGAALQAYWATATPVPGGGNRAFGTNVTGTVFQALQQTPLAMTDRAAPAGSSPIQ